MSGNIQVEMQIHHPHASVVGEPVSKHGLGASSSTSSELNSSSGSTGEDSSGEEPMHHHHHHVVPKKIRLKEVASSSSGSVVKPASTSTLVSMICAGKSSGREESMEDAMHEVDDECSNGPSSLKDSKIANSLTSGENSDIEAEDSVGSHSKLEDPAKKMFECDVCNMRFSNGANMRRHRMRHSGIKPFECKTCQKRFFRKDHLAEHMATHSKLLPFRCPICNKGFQRQIAMRAHFQNEHVGGAQEMVKTCPLCAYKAGSMKSLRVHFFSRHGIDLDNPTPQTQSMGSGRSTGSPLPAPAVEYSELAHALGFEDREKCNNSMIPSHFLVPQIEISSNSSYAAPFSFSSDSSYGYSNEDGHFGKRSDTPTQNISPQSELSSTSTELIKKEYNEESVQDSIPNGSSKGSLKEIPEDDVQDMPEDLSSTNTNSYRVTETPSKCSPVNEVSALKSLLREEWRAPEESQNNTCKSSTARERSDSSSGLSSNSTFQNQSCDGEVISSSNGSDATSQLYARRGTQQFQSIHQCVYCGIIFPDSVLHFLHKGCHSESNPWRCNICGELCTNVYDFNSHLLSKPHQ